MDEQGTIAELNYDLSSITAEKGVLEKELKEIKIYNDGLIEEIRLTKESLGELRFNTKDIFVKSVAFDKMIKKGGSKNIAVLCECSVALKRCWSQFVGLLGESKDITFSVQSTVMLFTDGGCIKLYIDQKGLDMRGMQFDQILKYYW